MHARRAAMPKLLLWTESTIRQRAGRESLAWGEEYFERGAVVRLTRRGELLVWPSAAPMRPT